MAIKVQKLFQKHIMTHKHQQENKNPKTSMSVISSTIERQSKSSKCICVDAFDPWSSKQLFQKYIKAHRHQLAIKY